MVPFYGKIKLLEMSLGSSITMHYNYSSMQILGGKLNSWGGGGGGGGGELPLCSPFPNETLLWKEVLLSEQRNHVP